MATARAVDEHVARLDQRLHLAAGPAGEQRHRAVEPLPRERLGHRELLSHRRLTHARHVARRMSVRTAQITMRIAPIVIAESATLNVGNRPTCTKSTTAPCRKPGDRNTRSMRLPSAPPSTSESPTTISGSRARRTARTRKHRHHDGDDRQQRRERLEQAERAPGVAGQARSRCRRRRSMIGASARSRTAQSFESWSSTHDAEHDRGREHRPARVPREAELVASGVARHEPCSRRRSRRRAGPRAARG